MVFFQWTLVSPRAPESRLAAPVARNEPPSAAREQLRIDEISSAAKRLSPDCSAAAPLDAHDLLPCSALDA